MHIITVLLRQHELMELLFVTSDYTEGCTSENGNAIMDTLIVIVVENFILVLV